MKRKCAPAYDEMFSHVRTGAARRRDSSGVSVQPMVSLPGGIELIIGAKKDPVFGPVIMVGFGGIAAELFHDRALGLPPLNERSRTTCSSRCGPGRC